MTWSELSGHRWHDDVATALGRSNWELRSRNDAGAAAGVGIAWTTGNDGGVGAAIVRPLAWAICRLKAKDIGPGAGADTEIVLDDTPPPVGVGLELANLLDAVV